MSLSEDGWARPALLRLIFMDDGWTGSPGGGDLRKTSHCEKSAPFKARARKVCEPQGWTASPTGFWWLLYRRSADSLHHPGGELWALAPLSPPTTPPHPHPTSLPSLVCRPLYSRATIDWRSHAGRRRMHPQWKWKDGTSSKQWLEML